MRRPRFGETGHRPLATAFVIRASDFPRHSTFGFRHFSTCRSYDRKLPERWQISKWKCFRAAACWRSKIMDTIRGEELLARLNWRSATKQFDPTRKISPGDWATLENALILSPSSYGLQPWRFIVISDQKMREKLFPSTSCGQGSRVSGLLGGRLSCGRRQVRKSKKSALQSRRRDSHCVSQCLAAGAAETSANFHAIRNC